MEENKINQFTKKKFLASTTMNPETFLKSTFFFPFKNFQIFSHQTFYCFFKMVLTTADDHASNKVATTSQQSALSTAKSFIMGPPMAAGVAGLMEVSIFHPFDTVSKRLMSHEGKVIVLSDARGSLERLQGIILQQNKIQNSSTTTTSGAETKNFEKKPAAAVQLRPVEVAKSLYRGTKWAVCYKVSQRIVKFAGQPLLRDFVHDRGAGDKFTEKFGKKSGKILLESTCGAVVGSFEIILLPFDRMKVLSQTNAAALKNRGIVSVIHQEGIRTLYAGATTTLVRNVPGSFALFCGTAFVKDTVFHLEDYRKATWYQNFVASAAGASLGVFITSPMDVIKTRIQSKEMGRKVSGWEIFSKTVKNEGFSAFYKGITPKIASVSPRLVFAYTVTEQLSAWFKKQKK